MDRQNLVEVQPNKVMLHENITDILFKHKEAIHRKLIDLRGTFLIDHIAINIISPDNKIVIFSITPSVEYNLIIQGLWRYDKSFLPTHHLEDLFYFWEESYSKEYFNEIKFIKEQKHGFTLGFNLVKKTGHFQFIYSYATRSQNRDLPEYYRNQINALQDLGDYGYRLIRDIYSAYCDPKFILPCVIDGHKHRGKPFLKLIIDNK